MTVTTPCQVSVSTPRCTEVWPTVSLGVRLPFWLFSDRHGGEEVNIHRVYVFVNVYPTFLSKGFSCKGYVVVKPCGRDKRNVKPGPWKSLKVLDYKNGSKTKRSPHPLSAHSYSPFSVETCQKVPIVSGDWYLKVDR